MALGITGKGAVVLAWLAAACNGGREPSDADRHDRHGSKIAAARSLDPVGASDMTRRRRQVSWTNWPSKRAQVGALLTTRLAPGAPAAAPHAPLGRLDPVAADGGGDRLVRQVHPASAGQGSRRGVPAGGSSVAPAPLSLSGWPWNAGAAAAAYGRGFALLTVSPPADRRPS